ncbi:MAG: MFS transporter [Aigarchaeota archaeon]|nr:MFS transporter [Candidatus Pelearchaeum maunauluense]
MSINENFPFIRFGSGLALVGLSIAAMMWMSQVLATNEFNASYTDLGIMGALRSILYIVLPFLIGYILHRVNKKYALTLSAVFMSLSSLTLAFSKDLLGVFLSQVVFGAALVFYWPVAEALLADVFKPEERLRAFGKYSAACSLGFMLGAIFGGVVGQLIGLRSMFMLSAIISAAAIPPLLGLKVSGYSNTKPKAISISFFTALIPAYVLTLPFTATLASVLALVPGYAANIGFVELEIGLMSVPMWFFRVVASIYLAMRPPKNMFHVLLLVGFMMGGPLILNAFIPGYPTMILLLILVGTSASIFYAVIFYIVSAVASERPEVAIGGFESMIGIGFFVGPPISGALADMLGISNLFLLLAAASLAAGMASSVFRQR